MPEQVWDEANRPEQGLRSAQPAGSAVPLVWAHAEYLKLLRSATGRKGVRPHRPCVRRAIAEPEGRKNCARTLEFYTRPPAHPENQRRRYLRILDEVDLKWCGPWTAGRRRIARRAAAWATRDTAPTLPPPGRREPVVYHGLFTGRSKSRWLGYNVAVKIEADTAVNSNFRAEFTRGIAEVNGC